MALHKKLSSCVTLLRTLVGSGWGPDAKTLCTAALSLVYSTVEYCALVWCNNTHTHLIDSVLNDALCIVTGYLHSTPTELLPILPNIKPTKLYQLGVTLFLTYHGFLNSNQTLFGLLSESSDTHQERLRSKCLLPPAVQNSLNNFARLGI